MPTPVHMAHTDLVAGLTAAVVAGRAVPCLDGTDRWLSDCTAVREEAAALCAGCPVWLLCEDLAVVSDAAFGVYAGRDRTMYPDRQPRTSAARVARHIRAAA